MKILLPLVVVLFTGCTATKIDNFEPKHPANPSHKHTYSKPLLADYHAFKPVEAGDWKALNRKVAPQ